ncbi:MAG: hypothetical protein IKA71_05065 [Lentisphaeria bacterium]|nr:hypothetical protein [Lentisphaeria bacterium]
MKQYIIPACTALLFSAVSFAGSPAAPYDNTRIDARLNVSVKENTNVVHFVRDNADPNVITKAYVIKNADPYELRGYLRKIVQTRKINDNMTNIQIVKYSDGTAVLLVSAEDYRFEDSDIAQGFDSIIKELDKPKVVSSSGRPTFVYSPKYRTAEDLLAMVRTIGADCVSTPSANVDNMTNLGGADDLASDPGLNLLFFTASPFSRPTILKMLAEYDKPYPEVQAKVTVYELYAENDTKLGLDFQAWKNNDGIDLFSAGGRFSRNHNGAALVDGLKYNDTTYFQFNPKWNTKYIDFLTSKGKAKIVHTAELSLRNRTTGNISKKTQVFFAKATALDNDEYIEAYTALNVSAVSEIGTDTHGNTISVDAPAKMTVLKLGKGDLFEYTLRLDKNSDSSFVVNGQKAGKKVIAQSIAENIELALQDNNAGHQRGNEINTEASQDFGFDIQLTPSVNQKATSLNVVINNSSMIGYTSDGTPRIQKNAKIDTDFMISNAGTKLVIGGIEKRNVIKVSGGLPILKDLPLLGWIFSTETEATKRSQLLVVVEVLPKAKADNRQNAIKDIQKELVKAGESNTYGYRQFLIDSNRSK